MVGLWWLGFSQIPLRRLPDDTTDNPKVNLFTKGYEEIKKVWRIVKADRNTMLFLVSFFCYNGAVNAVLYLAATFAEKELHFDATGLIVLVLILQLVAVGGAWASTKLSDRKGNRFSLMFQLVIWSVICVTGYFVVTGIQFYLLAAAVGLVMGGIQALSRSTYAKLLPENTPDTASYFSFFDVMDKLSTVMGTFLFGFVEQITGGMRNSVASLAVLFVISMVVLMQVRIVRMRNNHL
jgi:UMF1 family MFS transporter